MRKIILLAKWGTLSSMLSFFILFVSPKITYATITAIQDPNPADINTESITFTLRSDGNDIINDQKYTFGFFKDKAPREGSVTGCSDNNKDMETGRKLSASGELTATFVLRGVNREKGTWVYKVWLGQGCQDFKKDRIIFTDIFTIAPPLNPSLEGAPTTGQPAVKPKSGCREYQKDSPQEFLIQNIQPNTKYKIWIEGGSSIEKEYAPNQIATSSGLPTATESFDVGNLGSKKVCLTVGNNSGCDYWTEISVIAGTPTTCTLAQASNEPGIPTVPELPTPVPPLPQCAEWANLQGAPIPTPQLDYIEGHDIKTTDLKCIAVGTAVGKISTEPFEFVKSILSKLLSLAGGIAVIFIIIAGYRLMTSQGNPEAVKAAQEQLTSAIVGFLFIIFSLVILQVIGVDILKIPGFGK